MNKKNKIDLQKNRLPKASKKMLVRFIVYIVVIIFLVGLTFYNPFTKNNQQEVEVEQIDQITLDPSSIEP